MNKSLLDNLDFFRERLRTARKEARLSIVELARKTGVSPASISKIEKAKMVPTIAVLLRIIRVYDKPLAFFFKENSSSIECYVTQSSQRNRATGLTGVTKHGSEIEILSAPSTNGIVDSAIITLGRGVSSAGNQVTHSGEELGYCLKGKIEVILGTSSVILDEGDSAHFDGSIPHNYRNAGVGEAKVIYFIARPQK